MGSIRTPSLGPLLVPCASWVAPDALSCSVTGQGLSGCPGAYERSVAGRTGAGVSSPQAQDSCQKQIWLKAAQSGRLFQKAREASGWPRFCEASSADSSLVSAARAEQGPRRVLLEGGLGDLGEDTTGKQLSAQRGGRFNQQRCLFNSTSNPRDPVGPCRPPSCPL